MSLINDALKRAKQAQQPHSPDAPHMKVQFRPVESNQRRPKKGNAGIWITVFIVACLIVGFVVRQSTRNNTPTPKEAKAREIVPAAPIVQKTTPPVPASTPAPAPAPSLPAAITAAATPNPVAPVTTTAPAPNPVTQEPVAKETTAPAPVVIQEPVEKIVPKLQAVVFNPKRPSAIISGKSVFAGDRVGEFRVVTITQESVTLVGGGQTNVLVLGE